MVPELPQEKVQRGRVPLVVGEFQGKGGESMAEGELVEKMAKLQLHHKSRFS